MQNKKKKLLFAAYTLEIGGIETALVMLLNYLALKYDVTLVLEKKQGELLSDLDKNIKIIDYKPNQSKNVLLRRSINLLKRIKFIIKYKNKFDFGACFATYSLMASFCSRTASKNNALWVHSDYLGVYKNNKDEMVKFFKFVEYDKFKQIICVSQKAKESFDIVFPLCKSKTQVINNIVDYKRIGKQSLEKIDLNKEKNILTLLNVARHDEDSKKLTRLIEVAKRLKNDNYKFRILFIGEGKDTNLYKELVKKNSLEDVIYFLGYKKNPYPYFKISDAIVLTSDYEGYPVVFTEAFVLNIPIITTDISDSKKDIDGKYGIVSEKNIDDIYNSIKEFIVNGFAIKEKFDAQKYNNDIIDKIEKII